MHSQQPKAEHFDVHFADGRDTNDLYLEWLFYWEYSLTLRYREHISAQNGSLQLLSSEFDYPRDADKNNRK